MEDACKKERTESFPDGTPIDPILLSDELPDPGILGPVFPLTAHGIDPDENRVQTRAIQELIDRMAATGGGVLTVPAGVFRTGALFFPLGVHLRLEEGAVLKGSDRLADYPLLETRIEGETCCYFAALINVDHADGFTMLGPGTVDGNGQRSWEAFWLRRQWNPACTNKDEQRPRLIYIANSSHVTLRGLRLRDSHFWTCHLYRCDHVRLLGCRISSPAAPVPAPSTDAIDLDVCADVVIRGCSLSVNDDAIALKGGKGLRADVLPENGPVERVLIEDCDFGFSHSCLTCGSEAIHCRNILFRRCRVEGAVNVLRLKMRPDTLQHYEHILVENITGQAAALLNMHGWSQFADPDVSPAPPSVAEGVTLRNCNLRCDRLLDLDPRESGIDARMFSLKDIQADTRESGFPPERLSAAYPGSHAENVLIRKNPEQPCVQAADIM